MISEIIFLFVNSPLFRCVFFVNVAITEFLNKWGQRAYLTRSLWYRKVGVAKGKTSSDWSVSLVQLYPFTLS